ncbi:MAG TPA: LuxR C-terminal-related transcriptional regulator [Pseudonocardia sp.]
MEAEWPLTGRDSELRALSAALRTPGHRGVVLAGAAGLGKTRLAVECLRLAESMGLRTAHATATRAASGIPFGAFAPFLPVDQPGATEDRADLLRRTTALLAERGQRPGFAGFALLVDDAHLLDPASATLVHQLASTGAVFVLATVRAGMAAPDPIVALWKDGLLDRLDVAGLPADPIAELLARVLGGAVDPAATAELARRCEGNVLFLRELVLGALQSGTLRADGHLWRLVAPLSPSDRLVELVEARLGDLSSSERALLEVLAIGEPLGGGQLAAFGDRALAERLERKALISSSRDGRRLEVRLAHTIYGDVLRARMPPLRVASVSRLLAEGVENWGARRREDTLRVATWRLDGGGGGPELMLEAATIARWRYDFALAERLVAHCLAAGGGFDAGFLAAQLAGLRGEPERAESLLAGLRPSTDDQRGRVAICRLDTIAFHLGDIQRALRIATTAEAALTEPGWRHKIAGRRAALQLATTGPGAAAATAVPLLDQADGPALVWACQVAAYSLSRLGELEAALSASVRGHQAQCALTEPVDWYPLDWHPWVQLFNACEIHANAGRLAEAEAIAREQYRDALAQRSVEAQAWFAWQLTKTLGQRGRVRTSARYGREAVALFDRLGRPQFTAFCLAHLIPVLVAAGEAGSAEEASAQLRGLRVSGNLMMATDMRLARAWTSVARGDLVKARSELLRTVELAERIGDHVAEATALHDLCRLGYPADAATRLAELVGVVQGPMAAARAGHAQALLSADGSALERVADEFAVMGADLLAAEAASDASVAWRRAGEARGASRATRSATVWLDRCEGAVTPALQPAASRAALTPAERETALLAASGRTTKAIAVELQVSARTVSNHLQRAYHKLGINGRAELAACLNVRGPERELLD